MMNRILLLSVFIGLSLTAVANPVSPEEALQKAREFLFQDKPMRVKGHRGLELAYTMMPPQIQAGEASPLLYAFNISNDEGFVIVSGDDAVPALIGVGEKGRFDIDSIPCGMRMWLDVTSERIAMVRVKGVPTRSVAVSTSSGSLAVMYRAMSTTTARSTSRMSR